MLLRNISYINIKINNMERKKYKFYIFILKKSVFYVIFLIFEAKLPKKRKKAEVRKRDRDFDVESVRQSLIKVHT